MSESIETTNGFSFFDLASPREQMLRSDKSMRNQAIFWLTAMTIVNLFVQGTG